MLSSHVSKATKKMGKWNKKPPYMDVRISPHAKIQSSMGPVMKAKAMKKKHSAMMGY